MLNTFFQDLKIIELASVLAGPAVGLFFAELGAEVIKIENKNTCGDITRHWKLPSEDKKAPLSAYYCSVNWNKKSIFVDLNTAEELAQVKELIQEADVVISNFKAGAAQKYGLDYSALQASNTRLIYANLSGFGEEETRPAFDIILQAEAGFLSMSGEPRGNPVKMPVALIDILAAHQLKEAILVSLLQRYKTGKGSFITVSLWETALASLANQATNWLMSGHIPQKMGCIHPNIAPYGDIFYTKDQRPLILAVGTDKHFQMLCQCLNIAQLAEDQRFKSNTNRVENREALQDALKTTFLSFESSKILPLLKENQIPIGEIKNLQQVFEDPKAQKLILKEATTEGKITQRVKTTAFSIAFS